MNTRNEPLLTVASITALVAALIAVGTAFGLSLTPDQQTAVLGLVAVVAPIVVGLVARRRVTPTERR
jgi:ABC-type spermidine/putrescine transport system permease subunit I